jgi:hypothetical protein
MSILKTGFFMIGGEDRFQRRVGILFPGRGGNIWGIL